MPNRKRNTNLISTSSSTIGDDRSSAFAPHRKAVPFVKKTPAVMPSPLQQSFLAPSFKPLPGVQTNSSLSPAFTSSTSSAGPSSTLGEEVPTSVQPKSSSMPAKVRASKQDIEALVKLGTTPIIKRGGHVSSVKHLTCHWYKEYGWCKKSEKECLYAHYDTGLYANAPRQIIPGQPAIAGKRLEVATRNLNLVANSLIASQVSRTPTPGFPAVMSSSLTPTTPSNDDQVQKLANDNQKLSYDIQQLVYDNQQLSNDNQQLVKDKQQLVKDNQQLSENNHKLSKDFQKLFNDNQQLANKSGILHSLIDQYAREKNSMTTSIQNLVREKEVVKSKLEQQKANYQHLVTAYQHLQIGQQQVIRSYNNMVAFIHGEEDQLIVQTTFPGRNPFGVIGTPSPNMDDPFVGRHS